MNEKQDPIIRTSAKEPGQRDDDRPTLVSFVIVEGFKWGGVVIALYVIVSFVFGLTSPAIQRLIAFLSWLFFGEPTSSD